MTTILNQQSRAKVSLLPSVQSMAISTQQFNVPHVFGPVFKSSSPVITTVFWLNFAILVDMVNIKRPIVIKATPNAFSSKSSDQLNFPFPISIFFMNLIPLFVPIRFLTIWAAKSFCTFFSAIKTESVLFPSFRKIARSTAINTVIFFYAITARIKFISTVFAVLFFASFWPAWRSFCAFIPYNFVSPDMSTWSRAKSPAILVGIKSDAAHFASFFHKSIITNYTQKTMYFAIACTRIEAAQRQARFEMEESAA